MDVLIAIWAFRVGVVQENNGLSDGVVTGLVIIKEDDQARLNLNSWGAPFSYKSHMNHNKTHKFPLRSLSPARSLTGARGIWPRASVNVRAACYYLAALRRWWCWWWWWWWWWW